jgi:ectoine hydroxylase-related dioxygenase (phytanoyl-CoA dioxygenase family)
MVELAAGRPITPWSGQPELLFSLPSSGVLEQRSTTAEPAPTTRPFAWHVDIDRLPEGGVTGVQFFTFLDTVEPGGGATVVATGSHRLVNDGTRKRFWDVKAELARRPFFRDLFSHDATPEDTLGAVGRADGVDLQVVELVGKPGDVYLMDLRVFHSRSPNTRETARMMVTQRFLLKSVRHQVKRRYDGLAAARAA